MPGDGFDQKRNIADLIASFASFARRVTWNLIRDLKPRILIGMKDTGAPVQIHDGNGYPQVRDRHTAAKTVEDNTSQAAQTFATPPGKVRRYLFYHAQNTTRVSYWTIAIDTGTVNQETSGTANRVNGALRGAIVKAGAAIIITDNNFVAADSVMVSLTYEEWDAGTHDGI